MSASAVNSEPAEKPAEKAAEKPAEKAAGLPAESVAERPAEGAAEGAAEKPAEKPKFEKVRLCSCCFGQGGRFTRKFLCTKEPGNWAHARQVRGGRAAIAAEWNRIAALQEKLRLPVRKTAQVCLYYALGHCERGTECGYLHLDFLEMPKGYKGVDPSVCARTKEEFVSTKGLGAWSDPDYDSSVEFEVKTPSLAPLYRKSAPAPADSDAEADTEADPPAATESKPSAPSAPDSDPIAWPALEGRSRRSHRSHRAGRRARKPAPPVVGPALRATVPKSGDLSAPDPGTWPPLGARHQ